MSKQTTTCAMTLFHTMPAYIRTHTRCWCDCIKANLSKQANALAHARSYSLTHSLTKSEWNEVGMMVYECMETEVRKCRARCTCMHSECVCVCVNAVVVHIYLFNSAKSSHPHLLLSSLANLILWWVCCVSCSFRIFISGLFSAHFSAFDLPCASSERVCAVFAVCCRFCPN